MRDLPIVLQRSRLPMDADLVDSKDESLDQENQGSAPAWMPGKRDTCPVV
jgi:hypothetical protein